MVPKEMSSVSKVAVGKKKVPPQGTIREDNKMAL